MEFITWFSIYLLFPL